MSQYEIFDSITIGVIVTTVVIGYAWWNFTGQYIAEDVIDWFKEQSDLKAKREERINNRYRGN